MRLLTRLFSRLVEGQKRMRNSQLELLTPPAESVVFLGDSITDMGMWHEWFPELVVANRGVSGERSDELLARLDLAFNEPAAAVILIGTNDLSSGVAEDTIVRNVDATLAWIRERHPGLPIVLQSVMPRAARYGGAVRSLNTRYERLATQRGARYLDLWPALAGEDGEIRPEYSLDRLHLTGAGYEAWVRLLRPLLVTA